jgi:hypothetical protein
LVTVSDSSPRVRHAGSADLRGRAVELLEAGIRADPVDLAR